MFQATQNVTPFIARTVTSWLIRPLSSASLESAKECLFAAFTSFMPGLTTRNYAGWIPPPVYRRTRPEWRRALDGNEASAARFASAPNLVKSAQNQIFPAAMMPLAHHQEEA